MNARSDNPERLDEIFRALADANRRKMIDRLTRGPASVSELAEPLDMALPSVVKHLAVLEAGGLVTSEKAGRVRTYRLDPDAISMVERWVVARKARWNAQFDRLAELFIDGSPTQSKKRK